MLEGKGVASKKRRESDPAHEGREVIGSSVIWGGASLAAPERWRLSSLVKVQRISPKV